MLCLRCGYILDGVNTKKCPECGRPFDPHFDRTFRRPGARHRLVIVIAVTSCGVAVGTIGGLLLSMFLASLVFHEAGQGII